MASVFRKKSLDRISSPEDLHEYIHATNPGLWIVFAAITVLLIGAVIWGFTGSIETKADCAVYVKKPADIGKTEDGYGLVLYTEISNASAVSEYISSHNGKLDLRVRRLDADGQTDDRYYVFDNCEMDLRYSFIGYPDEHQVECGDYNERAVRLAGLSSGDAVYLVFADCEGLRDELKLDENEDASFIAEIMLESIHPLKFVFN